MAKLMKMTTLQDSFSCNFNVLIAGMPRVLGVAELLDEWTAWRTECVRRRVFFDLNKKKDKLHLLLGLRKSCSISTRRLKSSARPKRTQMLSRT